MTAWFEEVAFHIERGDLLDILEHRNSSRYPGQGIFIEDEHTVLLKTIIPSRIPRRSTSVKRSTVNLDTDEKELLESVERGTGNPPAG